MAQLRNTSIDDTGNLSLPSGTTVQRPASPQQGMIRYNTTLNDTEYYDGVAWRSISDTGVEATGGTIIDTEIGGVAYRIHQFIATGNTTFTVTKGGEVEYLIVAGGGGGGAGRASSSWWAGGGGGAGGLLTGTTTVTPQAYTITVGVGGNGQVAGTNHQTATGVNGGNSTAFGLTAVGGGAGGSYIDANVNGRAGGSGGGAGGGGGTGGTGTAGQGNNGGSGIDGAAPGGGATGGGGGAGSIGVTAISGVSGNGGQGILSSIGGSNQFYAGGGGGGAPSSSGYVSTIGLGGLGGGAIGRVTVSGQGVSGTPNTGGGGGGMGGSPDIVNQGGNGGSGIVIVRYRRNASTTTNPNSVLTSLLPYYYARDVRPIIARDNLIIEFDAANLNSYPESGSVWNNLSNPSANVSINGPTFSRQYNGGFVYDGVNDYIIGSTPGNLNFTGSITVIVWMRFDAGDSIGNGAHIFGTSGRGDGLFRGNNGFNTILSIDGSNTLRVMTAFGGSGVQDYNTGFTVGVGEICQVGFIQNAGQNKAGVKNGIISPFTAFWSTQSFGNYVIGGEHNEGGNFVQTNWPRITVFMVKVYNRALSAQEISQNFNAVRGRYGI
jgi:hypothetical protein